jgi:hypothetical protein
MKKALLLCVLLSITSQAKESISSHNNIKERNDPTSIRIITNNMEFYLSSKNSVLLTEEKRIPFTAKSNSTLGILKPKGEKDIAVLIDGEEKQLSVGEKLKVPQTKCYIWLYNIKHGKAHFQLRC